MVTTTQITKALNFYRENYGPFTRREMEAAASPTRSWHTMAELMALRHAGIETRASANEALTAVEEQL